MATNLTTTTCQANDPIIQIHVCHPSKVAVPSSREQGTVYQGSVTMTNTSKFALVNAKVQLTMKDTLMGYDAGLLDSAGMKTPLITWDLGTIKSNMSITKQFKFRIDQVVLHPPPVGSDAQVQINVLPAYEIQYSTTDGFVSKSTAVVSKDVDPPGYVTVQLTDTFEDDPVIKITHKYWPTVYNPLNPDGYVQGDITVDNKAKLPINDLQLQLDIDDNSGRYTARIVDSNDVPVADPTFDLGSLAPNSTPAFQRFWWEVRLINGVTPESEDIEIRFNIMPYYTVEYQRNDETFKCLVPATAASS